MTLIPNLGATDLRWLWTPRPDRYSPVAEPQYPLHRKMSGLRGRCGRVRKTSLPEGFEPRAVQRIDSRRINYAIPTTITLIDLIPHTHTHIYRVRQKYLTIWQHSCEWNCWRGEFVLEGTSSETQSISVAILYCCGWEIAEKQRLLQKEKVQKDSLHLELLWKSNDCVRLLSEVLRLRECADNKGRHLTDTIFRKWIL